MRHFICRIACLRVLPCDAPSWATRKAQKQMRVGLPDARSSQRLESACVPETRTQPSGASRFRGLLGTPQHAICVRPRFTGTSHIPMCAVCLARCCADKQTWSASASNVHNLSLCASRGCTDPRHPVRTVPAVTQMPTTRVVGADTRPCLCHRGAPCPVSRTSGPRADCSSVLAQYPPPWLLACHRGLSGFGPLSVSILARLVAPVLDSPSVFHSRAIL